MKELSGDDYVRLAELHAGYCRSLAGKMCELHRLWHAVRLKPAIGSSLNKLHQIVHNLAGSAPMYGYRQLAGHAATLDEYLRAAIEDGANDARWHADCEQAYQALERSLHTAVQRGAP